MDTRQVSRRTRSVFEEDLIGTSSRLCANVNACTQHVHVCTHTNTGVLCTHVLLSVCICQHTCTNMPVCTDRSQISYASTAGMRASMLAHVSTPTSWRP